MLQISIRFFTRLREIIGKKEEFLEFAQEEIVTVNRVFKTLAQIYGEDFVKYIYDRETGNIKSYLQLLVNGKNTTRDGLQTELKNGDVLAILPPVSGG